MKRARHFRGDISRFLMWKRQKVMLPQKSRGPCHVFQRVISLSRLDDGMASSSILSLIKMKGLSLKARIKIPLHTTCLHDQAFEWEIRHWKESVCSNCQQSTGSHRVNSQKKEPLCVIHILVEGVGLHNWSLNGPTSICIYWGDNFFSTIFFLV